MAISVKREVVVDFKITRTVKRVSFLQFDTNIINFVIEENGQDADLSNITNIIANFRRPDKRVISQVLARNGNEIEYKLTNSEMLLTGVSELALHLYDDEDRVSIAKFQVIIDENIENGEQPTPDDIPLITQIIERVNERVGELNEYANQLTEVQNGLDSKANMTEVNEIGNDLIGRMNELGVNVESFEANATNQVKILNDKLITIGKSVKEYGVKGDGVTDDTVAIQQAIDGSFWEGKALYFPNGTYLISDTIKISRPITITGENFMGTRIVQQTANKDAFHILENVERGLLYNIAIFGDNETIYGERQTTGKGIVFHNNATCWHFNRVWLRGHTYGFYGGMMGHVNNIVIDNSFIEHCRFNAIHFVHGNGHQINNIIIRDNNVSGNGAHGISVFGNNILIQGNTIQGNKGVGISMNCDDIETVSSVTGYSAQSINVKDNYFELCRKGYIYGKADFKSDIGSSMYLFGVSIEDNYGSYANASVIDSDVTAYIKFDAPKSYFANPHLRFFFIKNNRISGELDTHCDFGGSLDKSSIVYISRWDRITGIGGALRMGIKAKTLSGLLRTKDIEYDSWNSAEITSTKEILYNLELDTLNDIRGIELGLWSTGSDITITFLLKYMDLTNEGAIKAIFLNTQTVDAATGYKTLRWDANESYEITSELVQACLSVTVTIPTGQADTIVYLLNPILYL